MRRRAFISLLGGAAVAWPLAVRAQQPGKLPTIGFFGAATPSAWRHRVASFVQRLRELGWIEGRTIAIDYRWADGRTGRLAEIAAEFARLKVDVIVTAGTPSTIAVKQATSVIPIVFALAGDPVANSLVASLAKPGGNVTGFSTQQSDLTGKRLELLREMVPGLREWPCWSIWAIPKTCWRGMKSGQQLARLVWKSSHSKSAEQRTLLRLRDAQGPCRSTIYPS